jgi:hypothetical protein
MNRGWVGFLAVAVLSLGACHASRESVSSGQIGCDPSQISISESETHLGWGDNSETWVAECEGRRFYCSRLNTATGGKYGGMSSQVSCKEALSQASSEGSNGPTGWTETATERGPVPAGGAGFTLGADLAHEQTACEAAGNQWQQVGAESTCSGPASPLAFAAQLTLRACGDKVCSISVRHRPPDHWMTFVSDLKARLAEKYGAPSEADEMVPRYCNDETAFARCLDGGEVRLRFGWKWPSGERVALIVAQLRKGTPAAVYIEYSKRSDSL